MKPITLIVTDILKSVYINNFTVDFVQTLQVDICNGTITLRFLPRFKSGIFFSPLGTGSTFYLTPPEIHSRLIGNDSVTLYHAIIATPDIRCHLIDNHMENDEIVNDGVTLQHKIIDDDDLGKRMSNISLKPRPQIEILQSINLKKWAMWLDDKEHAITVDIFPLYLTVKFKGEFSEALKPRTLTYEFPVEETRSQLAGKVNIFLY